MDAGRGRRKALALMRAFRVTLVILAIVSVSLAWMRQSATLLGLALVITAEELLESSVVIAALAGKGLRRP
jgi:hypothetical protein